MANPIKVLLQTTIPATDDDWGIERFSLLSGYIASLKDENGHPLCEVTARNRENGPDGNDPVLSNLDSSDFDELWLFAVDTGNGLSAEECRAITNFRKRGSGILATRDHQDLGSSICTLGGVGAAHFFHTKNLDPNEAHHQIDDTYTTDISWPNFHSGRNGDFQTVTPVEPVHELMRKSGGGSGVIHYFPAHPHEGGVGVPEGEQSARVLVTGKSIVTEQPFNLSVAFEHEKDEEGNTQGRAIAESSFHHFADYNWDVSKGAPSFVSEAPGDEYLRNPERLDDIKAYVRNAVVWLAS
ncbi:MAG TPA: hypothetical protein VH186_17925 [Chloroflexia bacterium]|nr:hypothetical protein [Chloroflexia bacterium]